MDYPQTKTVCQLDAQGVYLGQAQADLSPLESEQGVYLLPANCIDTSPPEIREGYMAQWQDGTWHYVALKQPSPSNYHTWDGETWVITPEQQAVKNAAEIAKVREAINALRDRKINGGVYVEPLDKWLDTDATAERNLLSAKSSFDLFGDAVGEIAWTCADNSILMLNKAKLIVIWQALMAAKTGNHANALRHKTAVEQAENPLEYDYSDGWTKTYEEHLLEERNG